jgi:hypothetical protein
VGSLENLWKSSCLQKGALGINTDLYAEIGNTTIIEQVAK